MASLRMFRYLTLLTLVSVVLSAVPDPVKKLAEGNQNFTIDVYEQLISGNDDNIVFSPISAETVLSLTTEGAKGATANQLIKALSLPKSSEERRAAFRYLTANRQTTNSVQLQTANRIYVAENFSVKKSFINVGVNDYRAGVQNLNFGNREDAANQINRWVEDQTNNKIRDIISPNSLSSDTALVLVNTLYLNAKWETPFDTHRTNKQPFYKLDNSSEKIDTLHSSDRAVYKYFHCGYLRAKFLELPYNNSNLSLNIILPDETDGLPRVESNLEAFLAPHDLRPENVAVAIPKFTISTSINFKPILEDLGIKLAFNPRSADFSGISDEEHLVISSVVQKAFINVTEAGTEAAAASAVTIGTTAVVIPPYTFNANHAFFYYIKDHESGIILFAGRFTNEH